MYRLSVTLCPNHCTYSRLYTLLTINSQHLEPSFILPIFGIIISIIGTWGLFFLSQIKTAQIATNKEIKEMNEDIRDILVNMGKHGEQVISLSHQFTMMHELISSLDKRISKLEQS